MNVILLLILGGPLASLVVGAQVVLTGGDLMLVGSAFASILTAVSMGIKMIWDKKQRDRSLNTEEQTQRAETRSVAFSELEKTIPGLGALVDRWQKEAAYEAARAENLEIEHAKRLEQLTSDLSAANARISELERGGNE